jgi:hypothetical protein
MSDTVYVVPRSRGGQCRYYHTDPDCRTLAREDVPEPFEYSRENIGDTRQLCRYCSGEAGQGGAGRSPHYKAAVEAGK